MPAQSDDGGVGYRKLDRGCRKLVSLLWLQGRIINAGIEQFLQTIGVTKVNQNVTNSNEDTVLPFLAVHSRLVDIERLGRYEIRNCFFPKFINED